MAVSIKSKEFADAWRLVSEALLYQIQNGGGIGMPIESAQVEVNVPASAPEVPVGETTSPQTEARTVDNERYVACPIRQPDNTYLFKNLKEDRQDESTYKVIRYTDGTCEFQLLNLTGEQRQIFKDNIFDRMPGAVGQWSGELTAESTINMVRAGKGVVRGRSIQIIEPLVVEFK